jgi:NitT/TauT family transport system substrate-binding protein
MLSKTHILFIFGAIATLLGVLAAQPEPDVSRPDNSLRIGFPPWIAFDVLLYAQHAGLFEDQGLEVELIRFDESSDVIRAVMEGSVDLGCFGIGTVACNHDGTPLDIVLITNVSSGADGIVAARGIESVSDLRGKRVGCKMRAINRLVLAEALEHHGLSFDDVTIVDLSNTAATQQFLDGSIDAAVLWEPGLSDVAATSGGGVIHRTSDLDSLVIDAIVARSECASSRTTEIEAVRTVWFEVLRTIDDRPEVVFGVVADTLGQNPVDLQRAWSGLRPGDRAMNERFLADGFQDTLAEISAKLGMPVPAPVGVFQASTPEAD